MFNNFLPIMADRKKQRAPNQTFSFGLLSSQVILNNLRFYVQKLFCRHEWLQLLLNGILKPATSIHSKGSHNLETIPQFFYRFINHFLPWRRKNGAHAKTDWGVRLMVQVTWSLLQLVSHWMNWQSDIYHSNITRTLQWNVSLIPYNNIL